MIDGEALERRWLGRNPLGSGRDRGGGGTPTTGTTPVRGEDSRRWSLRRLRLSNLDEAEVG
ncbi:hypothetical protein M6B38_398035 [Iris pallida]|uniref:Uncharacterized protein n=1 Tax=Iris pallida TaxID=29817 RepID=A0AAX6FVX2_IRIPA|nr:hypothetical protein M6B38_398035 [Iris pallida]